MFEARHHKSGLIATAFQTITLIYFNTVRNVRKTHGNAIFAILLNIAQSMIFIAVFYLMFTFLGRGMPKIPGADFMLYLMTGIFMFMLHNKSIGAVMSAEGSTSPMMKHAPMNTAISIASSALSALYLQIMAMLVILLIYHTCYKPLVIEEPSRILIMLLLAWLSGCAVGLLFLSLQPWAPDLIKMLKTIYTRANMFTSGKMFIANTMPGWLLPFFSWNPLFHIIDQVRGFAFINYTPRYTTMDYPLYFALSLIVVGMLGEFYTRKYASLSWKAGR